ncbi:MAG: ABC-2 family transporter protein [Acidimicrobiia bacterium]
MAVAHALLSRAKPLSGRVYWEVARRSFRRFATYRSATAAGVFTNTVFGFLHAYVLLAVVTERGEVGGLGPEGVVTFVFVTQGMLATVGAFGELDLSERIRTGDVVIDFHRPVDLQTYWLAQDLGRAGFQALGRGIPPFLLGALIFDLMLPTSVWQWTAFVVSVALAVVVGFALRFIAALSGFWLLDARGAAQLMTAVTMFFSGFIIPINFFPEWLAQIARLLPFVAVLQLPAEIFLGSGAGGVSGSGAIVALATQLFWCVVLLGVGRRVLARATRKVVAHGG